MYFLRNWVLPMLLAVLGAVLGLMVTGLPGLNIVETVDGQPVPGGYIAEADLASLLAEGKKIGSHIDFYGVPLAGDPRYWMVGTVVLFALLGYLIGRRFRRSPNS